jgi:hypothetical protein
LAAVLERACTARLPVASGWIEGYGHRRSVAVRCRRLERIVPTGDVEPDASQEADRFLIAGLEHTTKWLEFRVGLRTQTVNAYLVAVAFLATGYFAALSAAFR